MISTLISRGLAFGRLGRVGVDGSLTGGVFFSLFIAHLSLPWVAKKSFSVSPTILQSQRAPRRGASLGRHQCSPWLRFTAHSTHHITL